MKLSEQHFKHIALFIIALAVLLRILGLARSTSFFLDELNLARNLTEKSYWQLFFPLDYEQYAPPLFSQLSKLSANVIGYSEIGLRFFPFLLGIASLFLFYALLKRFFNPIILLYPLLLFCFNTYLYRHGIELKQYAVDVFLTVLWIWIATEVKQIELKNFLQLAVLGVLSIWFSMPVVFILFGVGIFLFFKNYSFFTAKCYTIGMCGLWLMSFGLLFYVNLQHGIQTKGLQAFHEEYFLAFPSSFENIEQSWRLLIGIFRAIVGKTALAIGCLLLCFFLGIYGIWQRQKQLLLLFLMPILACCFASILHYYSLIIRLSLFLFPIIILVAGFGVGFIIEKINSKIIIGLLIFLLFFSLLHRSAIPYFWSEYIRENPKAVLLQLSVVTDNNLPLYVTAGGTPGYQFYTVLADAPIRMSPTPLLYGHWSDNLIQLAEGWRNEGFQQIWIFDSHTFGVSKQQLEAQILEIGKVEQRLQAKSADAYLVRLE